MVLLRFVHISDTHISADPGFAHYGHGSLSNLKNLINAINALTFPVDFVLHTGDIAEDRSEEAYRLARRVLDGLRAPIHYVAGNHDDADAMQRVLLDRAPEDRRLDYGFSAGGVRVEVLDSRGPKDPEGTLTDGQLEAIRAVCVPHGPPLVICLHHPPFPLDSLWLDEGWMTPKGRTPTMLLDRGAEFLEALSPARDRIRGVFFGHVHRAYQVMHGGILFSCAPSAFAQLFTWPDLDRPAGAPFEPAGFNLVTITEERTIVRQHAVARPGQTTTAE